MAAVALARTVASDVAIAGNLALRQQAALATMEGVERAVSALFETGAIADASTDDPAHNYFASRQPGEDARGVPRALRTIDAYPESAAVFDVGDHFSLRYIVERLCLAPGSPSRENCALTPQSVEAASGAAPPGEPPRTPYYRVSIRVDGPAGAAAFAQALLGESSRHRMAWQVLDE
jgi:hypothetical protein